MKYNKEYNFIEMIVSDFDRYMNEVAKYFQKNPDKNRKTENYSNHVSILLINILNKLFKEIFYISHYP